MINIGSHLDGFENEPNCKTEWQKAGVASLKLYHEHEKWGHLVQKLSVGLEDTNKDLIARHQAYGGTAADWAQAFEWFDEFSPNMKAMMAVF